MLEAGYGATAEVTKHPPQLKQILDTRQRVLLDFFKPAAQLTNAPEPKSQPFDDKCQTVRDGGASGPVRNHASLRRAMFLKINEIARRVASARKQRAYNVTAFASTCNFQSHCEPGSAFSLFVFAVFDFALIWNLLGLETHQFSTEGANQ